MPRLSTADLAATVGGELVGDPSVQIDTVASLDEAGPDALSFLGNVKYKDQVLPSKAGCVIVPPDFQVEPPAGRAWIKSKNPSAAFSKVVEIFIPPPPKPGPGIHASAVVDPTAQLADDVHVGPCAVIDAEAVIGPGCIIEAGSFVGRETRMGRDCRLWPNATLRERCVLGDRVIIHSGTVIGSDGFGYEPNPTGHIKIPQVGIVQIDNDVEIGSNCAIDRARFGRTWIKTGTKIDNLVQIAHNVVIGELNFVVAQVGISGSASTGKGVILAGQAGVVGHLHIGDGCTIMGKAGIMNDTPPGTAWLGAPAVPRRDYFRQMAVTQKLPDMYKQMQAMQKELDALKAQLADSDAAASSD